MSGVVADLFANFYANTAPLKTGLNNASGMLKNFGKTLSSVGLGGVIPFLTAASAIAGVTKVVSSALKETAAYSDQIRELTRNTGMSVQESSKMIQVADDAQLSFSNLSTALRFAAKNGILLNMESMKKLSDEYLSIQDPLLRDQLLIKDFGRNGLEMSKIMELGSKQIDEFAASAKDAGLIMDAQGIKKMRDYEKATNALSQAWQGLKKDIALAIAPTITNVANELSKGATAQRSSNELLNEYNDAAKMGVIDSTKFARVLLELSTQNINGATAQARINQLIKESGLAYDTAQSKMDQFARAQRALYGENLPISPTAPIILPEAGAFKGGIKQLTGELVQGREAGLGSQAIQPLLDKINALPPASRNAANSFRADAMTIMESARVASGEIKMTDAARELADNLNISTTEATKKIKGVGNSVMAINGLSAQVDIYVVTHYISVGGSKYIDYKAGGESEILKLGRKSAKGDNFIVPGGYENDSYPMLVSSGERVIVIPKNKVNQIPKMRYGTGEGPGIGRRDPDGGGGGNNWGGILQSARDIVGGVRRSTLDPDVKDRQSSRGGMAERMAELNRESQKMMQKSFRDTITPMMSGLISSQTAKTQQQISAITSKQGEAATKNVMIGGEVLSELRAIRMGVEKLPIDVRDAVLMASG